MHLKRIKQTAALLHVSDVFCCALMEERLQNDFNGPLGSEGSPKSICGVPCDPPPPPVCVKHSSQLFFSPPRQLSAHAFFCACNDARLQSEVKAVCVDSFLRSRKSEAREGERERERRGGAAGVIFLVLMCQRQPWEKGIIIISSIGGGMASRTCLLILLHRLRGLPSGIHGMCSTSKKKNKRLREIH